MIVDPQNANNIVGEYTNGTTYSSTDGGHSFNNMSPTCMGQETVNGAGHTRPDCDPAARFVTPIIQDQQNANTWLLGGQFVWVTTAGWNTTCPVDRTKSCSWQHVYDTGAGHAVTALSSANNGQVIYAAWVAGGGNPGPAFASGIATNYGGTWHEVNRAGLPNRSSRASPSTPRTPPTRSTATRDGGSRAAASATCSRPTTAGHRGPTSRATCPTRRATPWCSSTAALATDIGMFTAREGRGQDTEWSRLGSGLPNVTADDVTIGPDGVLYVATHGRGGWRTGL